MNIPSERPKGTCPSCGCATSLWDTERRVLRSWDVDRGSTRRVSSPDGGLTWVTRVETAIDTFHVIQHTLRDGRTWVEEPDPAHDGGTRTIRTGYEDDRTLDEVLVSDDADIAVLMHDRHSWERLTVLMTYGRLLAPGRTPHEQLGAARDASAALRAGTPPMGLADLEALLSTPTAKALRRAMI